MEIVFNILFVVILLCASGCQNGNKEVQKVEEDVPPNLIFIIADDLGYADVGFNGSTEIPTPNIDRIANEGVKFTNGYVSYPVCGPSRAGLITGRYQGRFGFSRNPLFAPNDPNMGLPVAEETIAEYLQKADYKCAAVGKWHLGAHPSQRPLVQGFDDFFGFLTGGHRYFPEEWTFQDEYEINSQFDAYKTKLLRNNDRIEETEYLTDALSREAANYVEQYKDDPFFIYLAYNAPHAPLQATEKYLQRFSHIKDKKRRTYAAMVSAVDDGVGRVLDKLDALKLEKNTIVLFISDNGGLLKIKADNTPLRGGKGDMYEGGIRVPFAMRWPKQITASTVYDDPVITLDVFATMVSAQQSSVQPKNELDGVDLIPFVQGAQEGRPHDDLYWRKYDQRRYAIRKGDLKLLDDGSGMEFFDVTSDIAEKANILESNKEEAKELEKVHGEWLAQLRDPIFLGLRSDSIYNASHPDRFKRPE
ncbi:MAG: arylsulfatase A-like enzyme [Saprospiraceae bacterium]|jgi:arylsulfatase A-like enzyme